METTIGPDTTIGLNAARDKHEAIILKTSEEYTREAEDARQQRLDHNRDNWDMYHLNQDYSHKRPGQSKEFLPKVAMAVEQITEFFQQGLMDIDDWWRCDYKDGVNAQNIPITREEIKKILDRYLDRLKDGEGLLPFIGDTMKSGLLGSLIIVKCYGKMSKIPFYTFENKVKQGALSDKIKTLAGITRPEIEPVLKRGFRDEWELKFDLLMPFEYGIDPSDRKLYEYQQVFIDWFDAKRLSEGKDAIYDPVVLEDCGKELSEDWEHRMEQARESGQPIPIQGRKKLKIQEFWGSIVDTHTGDILYENVVWTVANNRHLIQKPTPNPFWHGKSPFITAPILRVPRSQWHKALMDAPSKLNRSINEIYNLILDSGMMAAYGLKQYRPDYMEDESSAAEGFVPGQSVAVTSDCPPGMKVIERVDTGAMSQESLSVYQLMNAEHNQAALTNDLRMGVLPNRMVKATEIVENSNSLNSIFTGISKVLERSFMEPLLEMSWKLCLQNMNNLDQPEMQAILGPERAMALAALSPQERYAKCVEATAFTVFGVSKTLAKMKDFKKLTAMLQTISASPILVQEFAQEFSMPKLLQQIMASLDINTEKLQMTPEEKQAAQARLMQSMLIQQRMNAGGNVGPGNIPQADATSAPQFATTEANARPS